MVKTLQRCIRDIDEGSRADSSSAKTTYLDSTSRSYEQEMNLQVNRADTVLDVPDYGLLNDLVWSDPSDTALDWEENERGVSFCYGKSVINSFLATHVSCGRAPVHL